MRKNSEKNRQASPGSDWERGRVAAVHRERFELWTQTGSVYARMKRGLRLSGQDMPTVGDVVFFSGGSGGDGVIQQIAPRSSFFARLDTWHGTRQAVAANFDWVLIATSLNEELNLNRLQRYLAQAEESGGKPAFLLTKADLATPEEIARQRTRVQAMAGDAPVLVLSAGTATGLEALEALLQPGQWAVLLGSSGVGKSSLINALTKDTVMKTGEIRVKDAHGRHTTVHRQAVRLPWGAVLMDTPGMRELALWDSAEGVAAAFPEIAAAAEACRFRDCSHTGEPGCAVLQGIQAGELDPVRVKNYQKLLAEAKRTRAIAHRKKK